MYLRVCVDACKKEREREKVLIEMAAGLVNRPLITLRVHRNRDLIATHWEVN